MKGRDSARLNITASMGHAMLAYSLATGGTFPATGTTWINTLQTAGEINTVPGSINYASGSACGSYATLGQNNLCYARTAATGPFIIYARLEATTNINKCGSPMTTAWAIFSSGDGRGGIVCTSGADPTSPATSLGTCGTSPCTSTNVFTL